MFNPSAERHTFAVRQEPNWPLARIAGHRNPFMEEEIGMKLRVTAALVLGVSLAGALMIGTGVANAADKDRWPGTTAGKPTPHVEGVPPHNHQGETA